MVVPVLTLLIVLPLATALAVAAVPRRACRWVAVGGSVLGLALGLWAFFDVERDTAADLQAAYEGSGGILERALDRAGLADPDTREVLRGLLRGQEPTSAAVRDALEALAGVRTALLRRREVVQLGQPASELERAEAGLSRARQRVAELTESYEALRLDLREFRRVAYGEQRRSFRRIEYRAWIPELGVSYFLALDGLSAALACLTQLVALLALGAVRRGTHVRRECVLLLCLQSGLLGTFLALDAVLLYSCWVLGLLPAYLTVATGRGGTERAGAALRFVLPHALSSVGLLVALAALALNAPDGPSFNLLALAEVAARDGIPADLQRLAFVGLFVGCAVRLPLVPLHGWLGALQEHTSAPSSAMIQGAFVKTGVFGLLRLAWPLCPDVVTSPGVATALGVLAGVTVVFAGLASLGRRRLSRLLTSLTILHAGLFVFALVSLTPASLAGGMLLSVTHGIAAAGACLALGMLRRRGIERLPHCAGLARSAPRLALLTSGLFLTLALVPGGGAFVGGLLALYGSWQSGLLEPWIAPWVIAGLLMSPTAVYLLLQRFWARASELPRGELRAAEASAITPALVLSVFLGLHPRLLLDGVHTWLHGFLKLLTD
ncbi:MAG: proton-conducting transporter membrane subunit [Planctomycetota bacterium]